MADLSGLKTRMWRRLLRIFFRFDKWHVSSLDQRKYAQDIISYCNERKRRHTFLEIGCGLGDILLNVNYELKNGFDADRKVLKAASFLTRKQRKEISFTVFNFPITYLKGKFDVITMVNWIHHIEPDVLKKKIEEYFRENLDPEGEIIIDTVQDPEYKYNHDINFLIKDLNCSLYRLGEYARQREVWAIKKKI